MNMLPHIRTLEKAAGVEPATTREHYRETTEEERRKYLRWLTGQAPYSATSLPIAAWDWIWNPAN